MKSAKADNANALPWVEGKAECVIERNSRRILYEANGDTRLPIASTTKIVTAATVLDYCPNIHSILTIPEEAVGIEGSSVYLNVGDKYSIEDLLYGLMLRSGNDCATALGLYCGKDIPHFAKMMNIMAQKAGAFNSNFVNPHGLPATNHYSTACDLCYLTCYAMENPIFCEIVSTAYYAPRNWKNKNKMLTMYEGANGGKTGYTKEAGRCLVSSAERNGMTLICTVLNCPTTYERSIKLLDDAFNSYQYVKILDKNTQFTLQNKDIESVAYSKNEFSYPLLDGELECIEIKTFPTENFNKRAKKDEIIGQFEIYLAKRLLFSGNLYKL